MCVPIDRSTQPTKAQELRTLNTLSRSPTLFDEGPSRLALSLSDTHTQTDTNNEKGHSECAAAVVVAVVLLLLYV